MITGIIIGVVATLAVEAVVIGAIFAVALYSSGPYSTPINWR